VAFPRDPEAFFVGNPAGATVELVEEEQVA
jgi:hypothetical protein